MSNPVHEILAILGDVVLIPNRRLTKCPIDDGWAALTLECMKDPKHIGSLIGKNLGVVLGKASGGLCTIDLDSDVDVEPFLAANPKLRETTRTKRVRGCNFWFYIGGHYPRSTSIRVRNGDSERAWGEWRADGNQTLICGEAIDKKKGETEPTRYKFLNRAKPIQISFEEIVFPANSNLGRGASIRLNTASCITASLHPCIPASLHNKSQTVLGNITAKIDAQKALNAELPQLVRLYTDFIEPRFQALRGQRNWFIVQAVPFLYRAVAARFVLPLVGCFYDCNRPLFNDTREQHMKEAKAMLEAVTRTYHGNLSADESRIYEALSEHEQGAFRICRDLALLPETNREPLTFFLSFNHLGDRLGLYPTQAMRIMVQLEIYGLLKPLKKGTRRAPGVPGIAGTYQWLLGSCP